MNAHCVFCELGTRSLNIVTIRNCYVAKVDLRIMDCEDVSWLQLALGCADWLSVVLAVVQTKSGVGGAPSCW